jgi:phosphoenolpyruvate carboxylase
MSLAKTDDRIAREYLALGDRDDLARLVTDELALTREWVVKIVGGDGLLSNKPVLQRAVKLRSPYVDALSLLQLRALRTLRDNPKDTPVDPDVQRLLLLAVSGVAAGLQNTG